jgi:hypothetical protein
MPLLLRLPLGRHFGCALRPGMWGRVLVGAAALSAVGSVSPRDAGAQTFPSQFVRIVVPFTPGSQTDILGRAYADKLQEIWKRDVIVENKPGLAGTATTAKAPPDGHTILLVSNGHAMIESLNANLTFDPVKDFTGIAKIAVIPGILVVNPDSGRPSRTSSRSPRQSPVASTMPPPASAAHRASASSFSKPRAGSTLCTCRIAASRKHIPA